MIVERISRRFTRELYLSKFLQPDSMYEFYTKGSDMLDWRQGHTYKFFVYYGITLLVYWLCGAIVFAQLNNMQFFYSLYFCMITLATIGTVNHERYCSIIY